MSRPAPRRRRRPRGPPPPRRRAGRPPAGPAMNRPTSRLTRSPPAAATTPAAATADATTSPARSGRLQKPRSPGGEVAPVGVHHHGAQPGGAHRPRPAPGVGGGRPPRLDHREARVARGGRAVERVELLEERPQVGGERDHAPSARRRAAIAPRRQGVGAQARHLLAGAGRPRGERGAGGGGVLQDGGGVVAVGEVRETGRATRSRTSAGPPGRRWPGDPRPSSAGQARRTSPRRWRRRPRPPPPACAGTRAAPRTGSGSR